MAAIRLTLQPVNRAPYFALALLVGTAAHAATKCEEQVVALTWKCMGENLDGDATGCRITAEIEADCGAHKAAAKQASPVTKRLIQSPPYVKVLPSRTTEKGIPQCRSATSVSDCVALEQRGVSGYWHNYRLVNSCNARFAVSVFDCFAKWAGGCQEKKVSIGPCETTGANEGYQSWNQDAELRY